MSECFRCKHCKSLEPLPKGDPGRIHRGQWGMLARGMVYCGLPGPGGYDRFRSADSKNECKFFTPEPDPARIETRYRVAKVLRTTFNQWILTRSINT